MPKSTEDSMVTYKPKPTRTSGGYQRAPATQPAKLKNPYAGYQRAPSSEQLRAQQDAQYQQMAKNYNGFNQLAQDAKTAANWLGQGVVAGWKQAQAIVGQAGSDWNYKNNNRYNGTYYQTGSPWNGQMSPNLRTGSAYQGTAYKLPNQDQLNGPLYYRENNPAYWQPAQPQLTSGQAADAARYQAQGDTHYWAGRQPYPNWSTADRDRSWNAYAARYQGQADRIAEDRARADAAMVARWEGQAADWLAKPEEPVTYQAPADYGYGGYGGWSDWGGGGGGGGWDSGGSAYKPEHAEDLVTWRI